MSKNNTSEKININEELWIKMEANDILYIISKSIRDYREKYNISQKQLANKIGVRQPMVVKLESGEYNPSIKSLVRIWNKLSTKEENFGMELLSAICEKIDRNYNYLISFQYNYKEENEEKEIINYQSIQIGKEKYNMQIDDELEILQEAS